MVGLEQITTFLAQFAYPGLVAVLLAAGLGLPIPEDIPLMVGGLLSAQGVTHVLGVFALSYVSILAGDAMIFGMGRRLGAKALQKPWAKKVLTHRRQERLTQHFHKHGMLTIVVARHLAFIRAPCFLMAGVARMPAWKFMMADALGACFSVPLFIAVGYKFGENLEYILARIKQYQTWALMGALGFLALFLGVRHALLMSQARQDALDAALDQAELNAQARTQAQPGAQEDEA